MVAEIICVGTELLLGDILNTNAQYLSRKLADIGVSVYFQTVVGDNEERLLKTLELAKSRSEVIILTGGLGPTSDDITKETVAESLNLNLNKDEKVYSKINNYFIQRNIKMSNNNIKQAYIPEGAIILENNNGTAPGVMIDKDNKVFIILPGPPYEMIPMFEDFVLSYLMNKSGEMIISKTLKLIGIGESIAANLLEDLINRQTNPTIAPYAKQSEVHFRITAKATNKDIANKLIEDLEEKVRDKLGKYIYTSEDKDLEEIVVEKLINKNLTISTAESCTGGLLSSVLVNCSGVSKVFKEGIITYSNESKIKELGVNENTINMFGAVSEETAREMALGIRSKANTNIGISITGIAGPKGGTKEKPVGLVYISISINNKIYVKKYNFIGNRIKIRNYAAKNALIYLNQILEENN